jgi:hypothetical protein
MGPKKKPRRRGGHSGLLGSFGGTMMGREIPSVLLANYGGPFLQAPPGLDELTRRSPGQGGGRGFPTKGVIAGTITAIHIAQTPAK